MKFVRLIENAILKSIAPNRPLPLQIDITNSCNLKCAHCYHANHSNYGALTLNQWFGLVDEYFALTNKLHYKPMILICGGEPTSSPIFIKILEYLGQRDSQTEIVVLSNGTLLSESLVNKMASLSQNLSIQISLDGPDSNRNDMIRGPGSFDRSLRGIDTLKKHGIRFQILTVLSMRSSTWVKDFFELAKKLEAKNLSFTRFIESGFANQLKNLEIDRALQPHELRQAMQTIIKYSAEFEVKTKTESPLFNLIYPGLGRNARFWEALIVDHQGYLLASSRSRIRLGHISQQTLESHFLKNPLFEQLRNAKVDTCGQCQFYSVCGGDRNAAFAANGDFLGPDPGCWLTKKERGTNAKFKKIFFNDAGILTNWKHSRGSEVG